jgi:hypothetical protein
MLWHAAGARVKGESPPRQPFDTAWESYPALFHQPVLCGHPRRCAGSMWEGRCQLHDTVSPTLVPPPRRTPRKRTVEPSKGVWPSAPHPPKTAPWRQISGARLLHHFWLCASIPATVLPSQALWEPGTTGHRHARCCAASGPPSAQPSSRRTDGDQTRSSHVATLEAAPGQAHDLPQHPPEARFSRTTINSTTLCVVPPYVALKPCGMTVNRLPFAYKRRRWSPGRRGRRIAARLHVFAFFHGICTSPQSKTSGTWRLLLLSRLACSLLCKHHGAPQYSAPSAPLLDVRPTAGTRINPCHCVA